MRHLAASTLVLTVVLSAATPGAARAATFGADLSLPANGTRTCAQGFFPDPFAASVVGVNYPSCTWWSAGSLTPGAGDALVPRGGGTLRRVRVNVGPVTGRMQVLVLRQRRHPNVGSAACCFFVAATPVFTPAPNGITELPTDIPVRNDLDPATGLENFDLLAVSSLDPGVPVPSWLGGTGYVGGAIGGVFPHWDPGVEQRPDLGMVTAGQVLVAGDVEPATTEPPPEPAVSVTQRGGLRTAGGRRTRVALRCTSTVRCDGVLRLQRRATPAAGSGLGRATFSLAPGASARVAVRLGAGARRTLRARGRGTAYACVTVAGRAMPAVRVTLRR